MTPYIYECIVYGWDGVWYMLLLLLYQIPIIFCPEKKFRAVLGFILMTGAMGGGMRNMVEHDIMPV